MDDPREHVCTSCGARYVTASAAWDCADLDDNDGGVVMSTN